MWREDLWLDAALSKHNPSEIADRDFQKTIE